MLVESICLLDEITNTLEIPFNEKLEHRSVLCNEREREPLHTQLVVMRVTYDARSQRFHVNNCMHVLENLPD